MPDIKLNFNLEEFFLNTFLKLSINWNMDSRLLNPGLQTAFLPASLTNEKSYSSIHNTIFNLKTIPFQAMILTKEK